MSSSSPTPTHKPRAHAGEAQRNPGTVARADDMARAWDTYEVQDAQRTFANAVKLRTRFVAGVPVVEYAGDSTHASTARNSMSRTDEVAIIRAWGCLSGARGRQVRRAGKASARRLHQPPAAADFTSPVRVRRSRGGRSVRAPNHRRPHGNLARPPAYSSNAQLPFGQPVRLMRALMHGTHLRPSATGAAQRVSRRAGLGVLDAAVAGVGVRVAGGGQHAAASTRRAFGPASATPAH